MDMDIAFAKAVAQGILLTREATTGKLPSLEELVSMEVDRIVLDPRLLRAVPGYRSKLVVSGVAGKLQLPAWDVDAADVWQALRDALDPDQRELFARFLEDEAVKDVCYGICARRGYKRTIEDRPARLLFLDVCDILGVAPPSGDDTKDMLRSYADIFKSISTT